MSKYEKLLERIRNTDISLTFEELEKVLLRNGYVPRNNGSSHYFFSKNGRGFTLPRHKPMGPIYIGMVKDALEKEGIL